MILVYVGDRVGRCIGDPAGVLRRFPWRTWCASWPVAVLPDRFRSNAVIIGVANYDDEGFRDIPAAANSVRAMQHVLHGLGGWPADRIKAMDSPSDCRAVVDELHDIAANTEDTLLLYYVGHGVLSSSSMDLCLTVKDTKSGRPDLYGIEYRRIKEAFKDSPARAKIAILDCCYSGRAIDALAGDALQEFTAADGVYTLIASDQIAHVPPLADQDNACTSFTGELVEIIRAGLPVHGDVLSLHDIYRELRRRLQERGLPRPNQSGTDLIGQAPFVINRDRGELAPGEIPEWLRAFSEGAVHEDALPDVEDGTYDPGFGDDVSLTELSSLIDVDVRRLRQALGHPKTRWFRRGRDAADRVVDLEGALRDLAESVPELAERVPLLWRSTSLMTPARLEASVTRDGCFLSLWKTQAARVCIAYPYNLPATMREPRDYMQLATALPVMPDVVVVVLYEHTTYGVDLHAVDTAHPDRRYFARWADLIRILGRALPWWPPALRRPADMARWAPGQAKSSTYEVVVRSDVPALIRLADTEPDGSAIRIAAIALAVELRDILIEQALTDIEDMETDDSYWAGTVTPARPETLGHRTYPPAPPDVIREGWLAISQRNDQLAWDCMQTAMREYGEEYFLFGRRFHLDSPAAGAAAEWLARLVPCPRTAAHAFVSGEDAAETYLDPATGMPAARFDGTLAYPDVMTYSSAAPHRLPTSSPLAEVILDEVIWVRTQDGVVYPAPCSDYRPHFGYSGSGPSALAIVLEALLKDIDSAPRYRDTPTVSAGLFAIAQKKWRPGTVLTRAQLLALLERTGREHSR
ncbi:hypothetical protein ABH935_005846 [Catenulispora sp. GAS73]|uniref:caspase family protein n=1 Tax=Catenulispora sp. GAS73 TaxID=3156269 RepID=UPI003518157A